MKTFICCLSNNTNTFFIFCWLGLSQHLGKFPIKTVQKRYQTVPRFSSFFLEEKFAYLSLHSKKEVC